MTWPTASERELSGQWEDNVYIQLYRLTGATGTYTGADSKTASYTLAMSYDNMHRITSKSQHLTQGNLQFDGTLNVGYDLTYTYGQEDGKKFQLDNVSDVNYRTEATPDENQKTRNSHAYEYDANGNLVYVNTGRTKKDGTTDEKAHERKLKWDEENRLLASDDDGFVTNYWYDADGKRTVKTSGESEQVYVNSEFAGGRTNTAKFSLYVSPYLVANQGGRYTKHIYIGSQRIVSKIGDSSSYGADPRRIEYAGSDSEGDAVHIDYSGKYSAQQEAIKENYATFGVPYNGTDHNDFESGEGFFGADALPAAGTAETSDGNFQEPDSYENLQFYYHPDHLGSSSYITNLDGEVVQHIEYVPFGEVFIEERNNIWNTPYLFNAKEFDEETGLYYYGARYYDPRLSLWLSTDPLEEKYPQITSYCFTNNNPLRYVDLDGNDWVEGIDGRIVWRNSVTVNNYQSVLKNGETYRGTDYVRYKEWDNTLAKGLVQEHYKSDKVLHYEKHNGVFQMDFTGSVVTAKELTGKSLNPQRNAEFGIVGTAYLNAVFSDGGTYTTATYQFASGPYGNGPTPNHNYTAYNVVPTNESGMQIYGETGWKVYIENYNGRDGLRIHPDTNSPGTAGCIGIHGTAKELKSLGKFFQDYIKTKGKNMKINFNIPNNPNYGNNGKANSNIGQ